MAKKTVPQKESEIIDGYTIKYHTNGQTIWSRGKIGDGQPKGYWECYRLNGTIKSSGYFHQRVPGSKLIGKSNFSYTKIF
jgi:hypothetical protein